MTALGEIKTICEEDGCPLIPTQLAHIGNAISAERHEARGIIRALLSAQLERAWKPWPRLVKLATDFSDRT